MFGALLGALKGIGSGISQSMQQEGGGGFDWQKLMGATQAFGQGMGPESDMGKGIASLGQGGQSFLKGRAADRAKNQAGQMQQAQANAPVETQTAGSAGIGGLTPQAPPQPDPVEMKQAADAAAQMAALSEAAPEPGSQLPVMPSIQIPGVEMTPEGYVRKQGQPLMY